MDGTNLMNHLDLQQFDFDRFDLPLESLQPSTRKHAQLQDSIKRCKPSDEKQTLAKLIEESDELWDEVTAEVRKHCEFVKILQDKFYEAFELLVKYSEVIKSLDKSSQKEIQQFLSKKKRTITFAEIAVYDGIRAVTSNEVQLVHNVRDLSELFLKSELYRSSHKADDVQDGQVSMPKSPTGKQYANRPASTNIAIKEPVCADHVLHIFDAWSDDILIGGRIDNYQHGYKLDIVIGSDDLKMRGKIDKQPNRRLQLCNDEGHPLEIRVGSLIIRINHKKRLFDRQAEPSTVSQHDNVDVVVNNYLHVPKEQKKCLSDPVIHWEMFPRRNSSYDQESINDFHSDLDYFTADEI